MKSSSVLSFFLVAFVTTLSSHILAGRLYVQGNNMYLAGEDNIGISRDLGKTWYWIQPGDDHGSAKYVTAVFGSGDNDIYVGTALPDHRDPHDGGGLWISHDAGKSWQYVHDAFYNWVSDITVKKLTNKVEIYVATFGGGLAISHDNGATWSTFSAANQPGWASNYVTRITVDGDNIYAATMDGSPPNNIRSFHDEYYNGGVTISHDGGKTWRTATVNDGLGSEWATGALAANDKLYAITHGVIGFTGGFAVSVDHGQTWKNKPIDPDKYGYSYPMQLSAVKNNIFVTNEYGNLYVSKDEGDSWSRLLTNGVSSIYGANNKLYAATAAGIYSCSYHSDAGTWICEAGG